MILRVVNVLRHAIALTALSWVLWSDVRGQDQAAESVDSRGLKWNQIAAARLASPPLGLPEPKIPSDNPLTLQKIALGRKLFFDRRLSLNQTMSCGMCHIPEQGFTNNELATPIGVQGHSLKRNAPTILNVAFARQLFVDGRASSLEQQAIAPLLNVDEMANPSAESLARKVAGLEDYRQLFAEAFGGGPTPDRIAQALASWERTLLAADSPFDRWRYAGQVAALTARQERGFRLFMGKAGCQQCHRVEDNHALFTDHKFHDTGIGYQNRQGGSQPSSLHVELASKMVVTIPPDVMRQVSQARPVDQGRFEVTQRAEDRWRYKTPGLRNVALTAPYMHDGSLSTLEAVVQFYNAGGIPHEGLDPLIRPLGLDDEEVSAIVAFLHSLTSSNLAELIADARSVAVGN